MLARLQQRIVDLYDLELALSVDDFVCDEPTARTLAGDDAGLRGEILFVVESADGPSVALYVDCEARRRAAAQAWLGDGAEFHACCLAAEGVSHFVYVAFRSDHALVTSELELELQAEIDKWALGALASWRDLRDPQWLIGRGVELVRLRERSRRLRARLFDEPRYLDDAGTERGDRYRTATRLAARYARTLEDRWIARGDLQALSSELRRFYRMGIREKIERIG